MGIKLQKRRKMNPQSFYNYCKKKSLLWERVFRWCAGLSILTTAALVVCTIVRFTNNSTPLMIVQTSLICLDAVVAAIGLLAILKHISWNETANIVEEDAYGRKLDESVFDIVGTVSTKKLYTKEDETDEEGR